MGMQCESISRVPELHPKRERKLIVAVALGSQRCVHDTRTVRVDPQAVRRTAAASSGTGAVVLRALIKFTSP